MLRWCKFHCRNRRGSRCRCIESSLAGLTPRHIVNGLNIFGVFFQMSEEIFAFRCSFLPLSSDVDLGFFERNIHYSFVSLRARLTKNEIKQFLDVSLKVVQSFKHVVIKSRL